MGEDTPRQDALIGAADAFRSYADKPLKAGFDRFQLKVGCRSVSYSQCAICKISRINGLRCQSRSISMVGGSLSGIRVLAKFYSAIY